ncbi:MAG: 4-hydroxybenzoate octaprenyltransferase [bacterium]
MKQRSIKSLIQSPKVDGLIRLTRLERPIGIFLLLWPTLWALWFAAEGLPSIKNLVIFILGVTLMRSAGCVINDYADRHIDGHVKRTQSRPLPQGLVTEKEALLLFAALCFTAFLLVLATNKLTIMLAPVGVALAAMYPFAKRFTHFPQIVLGAAFSWSIPMAFAAESGEIPRVCWTIYIVNLLWTVAYDTFYAMVDRDDDLKIGVKSTAILFDDMDLTVILWLQIMVLGGLLMIGGHFDMGPLYYLGVAGAGLLFWRQQNSTRLRDRDACFRAFLNNNRVGAVVFAGIAADFQLREQVAVLLGMS